MSDEQLDNDLKKRIKQVFDNYQDNTTDDGWQLLRKKYPEKDDRRVVAWLWRFAGAAAILLAILGIGLWVNYHPSGKKDLALKTRKNKNYDSTNVSKTAIAKNRSPLVGSGIRVANKHPKNSGYVFIDGITAKVPTGTNKQQNRYSKAVSSTVDSTNTLAYQLANRGKSLDIIDTSSIAKHDQKLTSGNGSKNPVPDQSKTAVNKPDNSIQALLEKDEKNNAAQNNTNKQKTQNKKVAFAIFAATYVNYSKGSSNQFNTGGGFTADFRLTDNLSILTGVSIAQNSLDYSNANSIQVSGVTAAPAALSYNYANSSTALAPSSTSLNASLVNLDVPVDLKYVFNPRKNNLYVAAGFNSGTFVNETYNYIYNYSASNNNANQSQDETNHKSFDNFYFAQMFNLSFGIGYPLGKNNQLIIEPFFKFPLSGLGDQHILFGSGGLNLKINFDPPKNKH